MTAPANKGQRLPSQPLTPEEVRRLLAACTGRGPLGVRNRALVAMLWRSGLRVSEVLALRPSDLDRDRRAVRVRRGKGGDARWAHANGELWTYLDAWLAVRERLHVGGRAPVFCTVSGGGKSSGKPLGTSYVRKLLAKLGRSAGITKRVHPHGLRASHAHALVQAGANIVAIRDQLGHKSLATTDAYLRRTGDAHLAELGKLEW